MSLYNLPRLTGREKSLNVHAVLRAVLHDFELTGRKTPSYLLHDFDLTGRKTPRYLLDDMLSFAHINPLESQLAMDTSGSHPQTSFADTLIRKNKNVPCQLTNVPAG